MTLAHQGQMLLHCVLWKLSFIGIHIWRTRDEDRVEILLSLFSPLDAAKSHTDPREQVPETAATVVCASLLSSIYSGSRFVSTDLILDSISLFERL